MPTGEDPEKWKLLSWFRELDWVIVGLTLLALAYAALAIAGLYFVARELLHHHWTPDDFVAWTIALLLSGVIWFYRSRIFSWGGRMQSMGTVSLRFSPTARLFDLTSRDPAGRPSRFRESGGPDGFWDALRLALQQRTESGRLERSGQLPQTNEECERLIRSDFGDFLSRAFGSWPPSPLRSESAMESGERPPNEAARNVWRDIRFTVTSVRYQSLSLGLLFYGTREVFKAIDENPEVFAELFHALAPHALDEALGANVSSWLDLDVTIPGRARRRALAKHDHESVAPSPSVLLVRYFAPLLPILLGLALVFVVAYNTYTESRTDISLTRKREDFLLERQEKLLEAQNARIGALESRLGTLLTLPATPTPPAPTPSAPVNTPQPPHPPPPAKP
jgi:hypothetical protein